MIVTIMNHDKPLGLRITTTTIICVRIRNAFASDTLFTHVRMLNNFDNTQLPPIAHRGIEPI